MLSPDQALVQTVDFFTPIVDDPFAWGRIAAANALSDVYAMGARPLTAMNLVGWPRSLGMELLGSVLEGGASTCDEAEVAVVGGHSVDDPEPKYGMAVTGSVHPDLVVRKSTASPGDDIVLTKPLGTGIVSAAIKDQEAPGEAVDAAIESMTTLNRAASEAMLEVGASAATDVTGFGLIGHLVQMLDDRMGALLEAGAIPVLPHAVDLADRGSFPGGSRRNYEMTRDVVDVRDLAGGERDVLFDAQTSGGLLIAVEEKRAEALLGSLHARGVEGAARIGRFVEGEARIEVAGR